MCGLVQLSPVGKDDWCVVLCSYLLLVKQLMCGLVQLSTVGKDDRCVVLCSYLLLVRMTDVWFCAVISSW